MGDFLEKIKLSGIIKPVLSKGEKMKILLTNSPFQYYMTTCFFHPDWGALNLSQLAAMVNKKHEVLLIDNWHGFFRQETVRKAVGTFKPDVLGVSNSTAADTNRVLALPNRSANIIQIC